MGRKKATDVRRDPISDWNMDKETKEFLLSKEVSVYHSGGGCVHLYYKGWLINPNENVGSHEDSYALDKIKLGQEVVFSQVWNDMGGTGMGRHGKIWKALEGMTRDGKV